MGLQSLNPLTVARRAVGVVRLLRHLRAMEARPDLEAELDFVLGKAAVPGAPPIRAVQDRQEIRALLELVRPERPRTVVEIGTSYGGTLFLWTRIAAPQALLVSIDLPGGPYGMGYTRPRVWLYRRLARERQRIELIRADSHHPATLARLTRLLAGQKIDLLFIDGDHTYDGVQRDFETYSPLVRPGGVVALHDVAPHPSYPDVHVDRFWNEIRQRYPARQFVTAPGAGAGEFGIGVLTMPQAAGASAAGGAAAA